MESMCLRLELIQRSVTVSCRSFMAKANAGSVKANQPLLSSERSPCTHLRNLLRSGRGFGVRAEAAAGFPASYESSEMCNTGEKMGGSNANGSVAIQTGGPGVGDGDGHGGHGNEGNNGGGDSNNNNNGDDGYGDSGHSGKILIGTAWWLIVQCIRILRMTTAMCGNGRPDLVWLAAVERVFEFVSVDLMMSAGMTSSLIAPSVLGVIEGTVMLFSGFAWFMTRLDAAMEELATFMLTGFVAVTAGLSWAVYMICSKCDIFQNSRDGNNDDDNDYAVE